MTQQPLADPGQVWDELGARLPSPGSTPTSTTPRGLRRVAVRRVAAPAARPEIRRDVALIDSGLRAVIRALVTGEAPWPLYLFGPAGTGKTSAALALLDHCGPVLPDGERAAELRDWLAAFVEVRTIPRVRIGLDNGRFDWSREGRSGTYTWADVRAALGRAPVVVFDEIGVGGHATDFRLDALIEVLDTRCNNPVRPFVVTGNVPPSQLEAIYDDRVADRVLAGTVYRLDCPSRRMTDTADPQKPG